MLVPPIQSVPQLLSETVGTDFLNGRNISSCRTLDQPQSPTLCKVRRISPCYSPPPTNSVLLRLGSCKTRPDICLPDMAMSGPHPVVTISTCLGRSSFAWTASASRAIRLGKLHVEPATDAWEPLGSPQVRAHRPAPNSGGYRGNLSATCSQCSTGKLKEHVGLRQQVVAVLHVFRYTLCSKTPNISKSSRYLSMARDRSTGTRSAVQNVHPLWEQPSTPSASLSFRSPQCQPITYTKSLPRAHKRT